MNQTMNIEFDFTENADRSQILTTLLDAMTDEQRQQFDDEIHAIGVPDHHHHHLSDVYETIDGLSVAQPVKDDMRAVYDILAHAEAAVHGCAVEETHFHEVGNVSGIRNALAICIAFAVLSPDKVIATPVQAGKGTIECAHGVLDIPAPATAAILQQGIPVCETRLEGERCTPTSAALIKHFVNEFRA